MKNENAQSIEVRLITRESTQSFSLGAHRFEAHTDEGAFSYEGDFPLGQILVGLETYQKECCYHGVSKAHCEIDWTDEEGKWHELRHLGTLYQNNLVFLFLPLEEELRKQGKGIPQAFLEEYVIDEAPTRLYENEVFFVSSTNYQGRRYRFEGDIFDADATSIYRIIDETEVEGELFDTLFALFHDRLYPNCTHLPRARRVSLKVGKGKRIIHLDNVLELYPEIERQYGLPHAFFSIYPVISGEGYHVGLRIDQVKGIRFLSFASNVELAKAKAALYLYCLPSLLALSEQRQKQLWEIERFTSYEYLAMDGRLGDLFDFYESFIDPSSCLAYYLTLKEAEAKAKEIDYTEEELDTAHRYLINLGRIYFQKALEMKKWGTILAMKTEKIL